MSNIPYVISFIQIGNAANGYISVVQSPEIPFKIKRVYWTYNTPTEVIRGNHSHEKLQQVICSVHGNILFKLENKAGDRFEFVLNQPSFGLYVPPGYWRTIEMSSDAVLLCLASEEYDEGDYIRNYATFKNNTGR